VGGGRLESDTEIGLWCEIIKSLGRADTLARGSVARKETVRWGGRGGNLLGLRTEQYKESRAK